MGKILTELMFEFLGEWEEDDDWGGSHEKDEDFGFVDFGGPPQGEKPKANDTGMSESNTSRLEEVDGNESVPNRGLSAERNHYNRNRVSNRGHGSVRGGRGGQGQYSGGRPQSQGHRQPSPRTSAVKRSNVSPLQSSFNKQHRPLIAESKFTKSNGYRLMSRLFCIC